MTNTFDDPSIIFETERGKVLRCACCERLEVQFGNVALAEDPDVFRRFCRIVAGLDLRTYAHASSERPVVLPIDGDKLNFRFTLDEANELKDLVDGAVATLELESLLRETLGEDARP